jgi:hypothetical protein
MTFSVKYVFVLSGLAIKNGNSAIRFVAALKLFLNM